MENALQTIASLTTRASQLTAELAAVRQEMEDICHAAELGQAESTERLRLAAKEAERLACEAAGNLTRAKDANTMLMDAFMQSQAHERESERRQKLQVQFMAMAAHELRSPLTPLMTSAEMLVLAHNDTVMLSRLELIIKRQVQQLERLINDLLDGSRIATGKLHVTMHAVDLRPIIEEAVTNVSAAVTSRNQRLARYFYEEGPLCVNGDASRLTQVFYNLLENASKYTPKEGNIDLYVLRLGELWVIMIKDTGIGMAKDTLPHIFDLYSQDTRAIARHKGGLGIGLAMVRDIVSSHGGTVVGHSDGPDMGSTFTVNLPVSEDETCVDG